MLPSSVHHQGKEKAIKRIMVMLLELDRRSLISAFLFVTSFQGLCCFLAASTKSYYSPQLHYSAPYIS